MEACELLAVELRLDRIEAELAGELPPHMRTFARAYRQGTAAPRAPDVLLRAFTLTTARAAVAHPVLADRGLALLRLVAPLAIEADAGVAAARAAPPSWAALTALAAARRAAARLRLGRDALEVLHRLHGAPAAAIDGDAALLPPPVAAWSVPDGVAVDDRVIERGWRALSARHGVTGTVHIERTVRGRPRTFVVEPAREVIVVVPAQLATPADRFAVLHELGHAVAALALPAGIPRVIDEAVAAYVARGIERPGDAAWYSPAAGGARARRGLVARRLDQIERQIERRIEHSSAGGDAAAPQIAERPPWALWHDPGAQAAYVAAEALADELDRAIGAAPGPGALAGALAGHRAAIDRLAAAAL